jgi:formate dehydrogenase subunit gamma
MKLHRFNKSALVFARAVSLSVAFGAAGMLALPVSAQAPTSAPATAASPTVAAASGAEAKPAPSLPANSTAQPGWNVPPKWSEVEVKPQYASVPGREMGVLVEDKGHWWRTIRNGPVTIYGGILLLVVPALLLAFFAVKGPFKLHAPLSGRLIERFNSAERMVHWTMALSFVALAITGVLLLFGKHVVQPLLGAAAFAWIAQLSKAVHNFIGPLFMFSLVIFFFMYVRDNFFKSYDFTWLSKLGGLLSGNHVPSGRFNGGEKLWFWLSIVLFGAVVSISGLLLLFPNWNTTRELMAEANLVHGIVGVVFMAFSIGHIYIGTIGTEGAYKGMREGYVDETWAKEHHAMWYDDVKSVKATAAPAGAAQPAAGDD